MSSGKRSTLLVRNPRHRHPLEMGVGIAEFLRLFDLQASIFVGSNVQSCHLLAGYASIRALQRESAL